MFGMDIKDWEASSRTHGERAGRMAGICGRGEVEEEAEMSGKEEACLGASSSMAASSSSAEQNVAAMLGLSPQKEVA